MAKRCECGCGGVATGGDFLPGHDQKLRAALERKAGGILALRTLVESNAPSGWALDGVAIASLPEPHYRVVLRCPNQHRVTVGPAELVPFAGPLPCPLCKGRDDLPQLWELPAVIRNES